MSKEHTEMTGRCQVSKYQALRSMPVNNK